MGLLKKVLEKYKQRKEKFKEMESDLHLQKVLNQRQKNANERELEAYYEDERQRAIKTQLERFRRNASNEMWKGNILKNGNKKLYNDNSLMRKGKSMICLRSRI